MEQTVIYLVMVQKFKRNILRLLQLHYAWETFQKIDQQILWKKTGFNGYAYDFSVNYGVIAVGDIKDIYKHLMKKNNIVQYVYA